MLICVPDNGNKIAGVTAKYMQTLASVGRKEGAA